MRQRRAGQHRAARPRLTTLQRLGAGAVLIGATGLGAVTWSGSAAADAPVQTGWWNTASGGGQAAPAPTTPDGGLHVAVAPGQVLAFGAVLYTLPKDATATLELTITSAQGTPALQACPTKDIGWKPGGDQAADAAPEYDCSVRSYTASLSADGKTATFLVDSSASVLPGTLSLAIVPVVTNEVPALGGDTPVDTTQPFSVDIDKPSATSLMVTSSAPPAPTTTGATTGGSTTSSTTTGTAGSGSSSAAGAPSGGGGATVPALGGGETTTQNPADTGTAPVVAPSDTSAAPNSAPVAAATPAKSDRAHNAALAMLLLIGIGIATMSNGQLQRAPRVLGGGRHAARHAAGHAAVAGAGAAGATAVSPPDPATAAMMAPYGVRGLGRFNKPRSTPPRPLI